MHAVFAIVLWHLCCLFFEAREVMQRFDCDAGCTRTERQAELHWTTFYIVSMSGQRMKFELQGARG
jgi:hypothetical protein